MAFWKQFVLSLIVIVAGFAAWVFFVPGAGDTMRDAGIPGSIVSKIAPKAEGTADADAPARAQGQQRGEGQGQNRRNADGRNSAILVATQAVVQGVVNDRLNAIGTGDAIRSVAVTPQASGTIREILIKSGDRVKAGQVLATLDSEEQVIARGQADVAVKAAVEKSNLYHNIKSSVSRMDVFDSEIAEQGARLQLQAAELNLARRNIIAPIDGIVGILPVNIGDNVTTSIPIVTLDDRSEILVDFWVPERFANTVSLGQPVEAMSVAKAGQVFSGMVEAVDNRIDAASRTLRLRAKIGNSSDELRAGMSFSVSMKFAGDKYPAVDPVSVQWDSQGSFVWRVNDDKSRKVRVSVVQRNPDFVLVKADLKDGDKIVTQGLQRVREGGAVRLSADVAANAEVATQ
ncbi:MULTISPECIES: efflux RND transporter periplasmic adaptor subunit [unclassified Rhizobium]|uniref:efflux RND transporter periplasmic adaptor subunit n=1 Tax=unclassified Rhizobium TaxID=2613769 RepID=UPI001A98480E|nr:MULTISPECIES: efflux RND transporter periplasmic adaptor subunit [unclassified Rhizobium]MBX5164915.1 efflux RND transporter periplasmic adaptor subunit [Rhizobium sp. NZLR4b]MBX5194996.1 efflux RND transporter periplasmic adaptor subunit [Rhizobium sp. NZLR10]MBX5204881.1 efflux RND transporter periplasmic adaptor subunit [Rhizobium sp. NZLR1]MBX5209730.1 efflux RND transporter periplasmic adaptor subunit [Rhizobium sp. NZLR11]QSZ19659.1 efflux RND transporter periplasmic adaptor subunit [